MYLLVLAEEAGTPFTLAAGSRVNPFTSGEDLVALGGVSAPGQLRVRLDIGVYDCRVVLCGGEGEEGREEGERRRERRRERDEGRGGGRETKGERRERGEGGGRERRERGEREKTKRKRMSEKKARGRKGREEREGEERE